MSEEVESQSKFLYSTFTSVLNLGIVTVLQRLNTGDANGVLAALRTLYDILPPTVSGEIQAEYRDWQTKVNDILRFTRHSDPFMEDLRTRDAVARIDPLNRALLRTIVQKLHAQGYLEKMPRKVPVGSE